MIRYSKYVTVEQTVGTPAAQNVGHADPVPPKANTMPSIARVTAWLARQSEVALGEVGISLPQYRLLNLLAEGTALPSSLADRLNLRRPSITAVVDGLVSRGLVAREHDSADRRKVSHSITPAGRGALGAADRAVDARLRMIAATLGREDLVAAAVEGLACWGPALQEWRKQKAAARGHG